MSDTALIFTRIDATKEEVEKGEYDLPRGAVPIDFVTDTVADKYNDGWRKGGWAVTRNGDGSTTLKSGTITYIFFTRKKKAALERRAYHTNHVDRFLYHCMKVLQVPKDDMPPVEGLSVDSMVKEFSGLPIPFSVILSRTEDEPIVKIQLGGEEYDFEEAERVLVGLRRIIAIIRKIQKKKERLDL